MKVGDSLFIVIHNGPNGVGVTPHIEREAAFEEVNQAITGMLRGRGRGFKDPGPEDPDARMDAWNEYQDQEVDDPFLLHVAEEPLVR